MQVYRAHEFAVDVRILKLGDLGAGSCCRISRSGEMTAPVLVSFLGNKL
jgi:hypothetical protein